MKYNREEIVIFIKQNLKEIILALLTSVAIGFVIFYLFFNNKNSFDTTKNIDSYIVDSNENTKKEDVNSEKIFVDIKGAVKNPGVYECDKDTRIKDAIEKAGGLLEDSDTTTINLSRKVHDQMLIIVPKQGEKIQESTENNKIININTASKEELMKITGIGETKAKAIIDYRENKGRFEKKEDIINVKGIGKGTFEKIKEEIDV